MSNKTENTKSRDAGRMIDDLVFLERLEAGLVTEDERRRFANELMADEDGRERYLAMCELGLFGEEAKADAKSKIAAKVKDATAPTGKSRKSAFSRAVPWVASCAVLVIVAGVYFNPNPTSTPDPGVVQPGGARTLSRNDSLLPTFAAGKLPVVILHPYSPDPSSKGGSSDNAQNKQVDPGKLQSSETDQDRFNYAVDALIPERGTNRTNSAAALDALKKCDESSQTSGDGLLLQGLICASSENWDEAAGYFSKALKTFEESSAVALKLDEARFNLTFALWQQGKIEEAKSNYEKVSQEYLEILEELGKSTPAVQDTLDDLEAALK